MNRNSRPIVMVVAACFLVSGGAGLSERIPAAELRALRLAPMKGVLLRDAQSDPASLRFYALDLMETYRAQRSIFYLPDTTDLGAILKRLIEVDPPQRRLYTVYLAELAWDKGDDTQCLALGQQALDSDSARSGPTDFSKDPAAPFVLLYRMAESLWRNGQIKQAWALCQNAQASGYLANASVLFPLFEVTYRRNEAAATSQSAPLHSGSQ